MKIELLVLDITCIGGIERVVSNLSNYFIGKKYEIKIISCFKKNDTIFYDINKNINVHYLSHKEFKKSSYSEMYQNIKFYLKKTNADVVIGFSTNINIFMGILKKYTKSILISTEHAQYNAHNRIIRLLKRIFYKKLDCTVALNETDKKLYQKFLKKVECIPNALSFVKNEKAPLNNKLIFSAGRLHKDKGFDQLIKAFSLISKENLEWTLEIAGEGPEKNNLLNLIKENNLEKQVKIIPFQEHIDKKFKEASIYAMSSRQECFPMVLIEAMSFGLPAVSFDCPNGPRDIIKEKEDGILVEEFSIDSFSSALIFLIKNPKDMKKMGEKAKQNIKRFSEEKIGEKWEKLFKGLIGDKND